MRNACRICACPPGCGVDECAITGVVDKAIFQGSAYIGEDFRITQEEMYTRLLDYCEREGFPVDGWRRTGSVPNNPLQIYDRIDDAGKRVNHAYVSGFKIKVYEDTYCGHLVISEGWL
ncbi:MAG: hypothetical protein ACOX10_01990 [Candidatus Methanomethylophilaceae archaeon]